MTVSIEMDTVKLTSFMYDGPTCAPDLERALFDNTYHLNLCQFIWWQYKKYPRLYCIPQPTCTLLHSKKDGRVGEYWDNLIRLVVRNRSARQVITTYAHEYRHHLQKQPGFKYSDSVMAASYPGSYWLSPCELDARAYAELLVAEYNREKPSCYLTI